MSGAASVAAANKTIAAKIANPPVAVLLVFGSIVNSGSRV
jgi:hypothetical protein